MPHEIPVQQIPAALGLPAVESPEVTHNSALLRTIVSSPRKTRGFVNRSAIVNRMIGAISSLVVLANPLLTVSFVSGCGGSPAASSSSNGSCPLDRDFFAWCPNSDQKCPTFAQVEAASVELKPTGIRLNIDLVTLPDVLTFDHATLETVEGSATLEYQWQAALDVYGDQSCLFWFNISAGKSVGETEHVGSLNGNARASVSVSYRNEEFSTAIPSTATISVVDGHVLNVDYKIDLNRALPESTLDVQTAFLDIVPSSPIRVATSYNDGASGVCNLVWPEYIPRE